MRLRIHFESCQLNREIADGSALLRPENHFETCALRRKSVQQGVFASPAHDKQALQVFPCDGLYRSQDFSITRGQAVKNRVGESRNGDIVDGIRLPPEALELCIDFAESVARDHQVWVINVD